jgi:transporter family-2 protein
LSRWIPIGAAFLVGVFTALQARINGQLSDVLDNALEAATISFGSGFIILVVFAAFNRRLRTGIVRVVDALRDGSLPRWQVLGGLMGGFFVVVQSATVPVIGVAIFIVAVVAGQTANSLIVDRIGLGPAGKQPINAWRVGAAVIALVAVALAVSDRLTGTASILPVAFALLAGVLVAVQQAINGRVGQVAGTPMTAAWANFFFGSLGLGMALGFVVLVFAAPVSTLPSGPWWLYTGGLIGAVYIATAAWVVPIIGVLVFVLVSISGQLVGSLILDWVWPIGGARVTWALVGGVLLAFVAVFVATRPGATSRIHSRMQG